jgi:glycosyltransferase involved in cell wall biosynthesis
MRLPQFIARNSVFQDAYQVFFGRVTISARIQIFKILRKVDYKSKNEILVIIPTFNNPTYLENMLRQLAALNLRNILVSDSGSTFSPMNQLLSELRNDGFNVIQFKRNVGPRVFWEDPWIFKCLPKYFMLSDPDLEFNQEMPLDFHLTLMRISDDLRVGKVGIALSLEDSYRFRNDKFLVGGFEYSVIEWEAQFWKDRIPNQSEIVYSANVDTTLALYNKLFFKRSLPYEAVRVAGRFSARHLPWYEDAMIPFAEADFYRKLNRIGFYGMQK